MESDRGPSVADGTDRKPVSRGRRIVRWLLLLVGLAVVLFALAPTLLSLRVVWEPAVNGVAENLGARIQIDELSLGWFDGVRVDGLVFDVAGSPDDAPLLAAETITARPRLLSLLSDSPDLGVTQVVRPRVFVRREEDGSLSTDRLDLPESTGSTDPSPLPSFTTELIDGEIVFQDQATGARVELTVNVEADGTPDGVSFAATMDTIATGEGVRLPARIEVSGAVDPDLAPEFSGRLLLPKQRLIEIAPEALAALELPPEAAEIRDSLDRSTSEATVEFEGDLEAVRSTFLGKIDGLFPPDAGRNEEPEGGPARRSVEIRTESTVLDLLGSPTVEVERYEVRTPIAKVTGAATLSEDLVLRVDGATRIALQRASSLLRKLLPPSLTTRGDLDVTFSAEMTPDLRLEARVTSSGSAMTLRVPGLEVPVLSREPFQAESTLIVNLATTTVEFQKTRLRARGIDGEWRGRLERLTDAAPAFEIDGTGTVDLERSRDLLLPYVPEGYEFSSGGTSRFTASLRGSLQGAIGSRLRRTRAAVEFDGGSFRVHETGTAANEAFEFDSPQGKVELARGKIRIAPFTMTANGGTVSADATIDLAPDRGTVEGKATLQGVRVNRAFLPVLAYLGPVFPGKKGNLTRLTGTLDGTLDLATRGKTPEALLNGFTGNGTIALVDGEVRGSPLLTRILTLLDRPAVFPFEGIETDLLVRDQSIVQRQLRVLGEDVSLDLDGVTTFAGTLRYGASLGGFADRIKERNEKNDWLQLLGRGTRIPIEIVGRIEDPDVRISLPSLEDTVKDVIRDGLDKLLQDQLDKLDKRNRKKRDKRD